MFLSIDIMSIVFDMMSVSEQLLAQRVCKDWKSIIEQRREVGLKPLSRAIKIPKNGDPVRNISP